MKLIFEKGEKNNYNSENRNHILDNCKYCWAIRHGNR